jgi:hypothetical protein
MILSKFLLTVGSNTLPPNLRATFARKFGALALFAAFWRLKLVIPAMALDQTVK